MTTSALVKGLIEKHHYILLDASNLDNFLESTVDSVLFLVGDTNSFPEGNDVAVILPELMSVFAERLTAAVVDSSIEREIQLRYRIKGWPSLVFVRNGKYLGSITRVQDWNVYLDKITEILSMEPSSPPPMDINKLCGAINSK